MESYDYYIDQYKQAHTDPKTFPGISIRYYVKDVAKLIKESGAETLLDFGCGKGQQYTNPELMKKWGPTPNKVWGIMPTLYDPAVEQYSNFPSGKFDGVVSTDVMEHVPEEAVDHVLELIFSKANKFVFMAIATYVGKPTSYKLPNGEQPHITVQSDSWWIDKISKHVPDNVTVGVCFNGRDAQGKQTITRWKTP